MIENINISSGRIFIIGDLHGCLSLLEQAKREVGFKDNEDMIIGVGDLVDRGADSPGCLELLDKPWFKSAKGNHEQILFEDYKEYKKTGHIYPINGVGNEWTQDFFPSESARRLIEKASRLPEVIKLSAFGERFHVVHASLCQGNKVLSLISDKELDEDPSLTDSELMYWESLAVNTMTRPKKNAEPYFSDQKNTLIEGHSLTICGHIKFQDYPVLSSSHFHIDTGAISSYQDERSSMSLLELNSGGKRLHQVSPIWGHYFFSITEF